MKQILAIAMGILSLGSFNVEASEITGLEAEAVIVFGEVIRRDVPFYLFDARSKIYYDEIHFDERVILRVSTINTFEQLTCNAGRRVMRFPLQRLTSQRGQ